jgi:hypothetical protein
MVPLVTCPPTALSLSISTWLHHCSPHAAGSNPDGSLRMLCRMKPMDFLSAGESTGLLGPGKADSNAANLKKPKVKIPKRRRVVHPPAELILLPVGISLKKLHTAVEDVFKSMYRMFSSFQVTPA